MKYVVLCKDTGGYTHKVDVEASDPVEALSMAVDGPLDGVRTREGFQVVHQGFYDRQQRRKRRHDCSLDEAPAQVKKAYKEAFYYDDEDEELDIPMSELSIGSLI